MEIQSTMYQILDTLVDESSGSTVLGGLCHRPHVQPLSKPDECSGFSLGLVANFTDCMSTPYS